MIHTLTEGNSSGSFTAVFLILDFFIFQLLWMLMHTCSDIILLRPGILAFLVIAKSKRRQGFGNAFEIYFTLFVETLKIIFILEHD